MALALTLNLLSVLTLPSCVQGPLVGLSMFASSYRIYKKQDCDRLQKIIGSGIFFALGAYFCATTISSLRIYNYFDKERGTIEYPIYSLIGNSTVGHKENCLMLTAIADHNQALNLTLMKASDTYARINAQCNIIHHQIGSVDQLCEAIKMTSQRLGSISELFIDAHGSSHMIELNTFNVITRYSIFPADCFSGLNHKAHIYLMSCSTGASLDGIAAYLAVESQRKVIAPDVSITNDDVHVGKMFDSQDSAGGIRYCNFIERIDKAFNNFFYFNTGRSLKDLLKDTEHLPDHTMICYPNAKCVLANLIEKRFSPLVLPFHYLMMSSSFMPIHIAFNIKLWSQIFGHAGNILDVGIDVTAPYIKNLAYFFSKREDVDRIGVKLYERSKLVSGRLISSGRVSDVVDNMIYYCIRFFAKSTMFVSSHIERSAEAQSNNVTSLRNPEISCIIKTTLVLTKITSKIFYWFGRSLEIALG